MSETYKTLIQSIIKLRQELDKFNTEQPTHTMKPEVNIEMEELIADLNERADFLIRVLNGNKRL